MSKGYSGRSFQCPYFKWDEREKVHCEGGVVNLPIQELRRYMDRHCSSAKGWEECPIARSLNEYYDRKK